MILWMSTRLWKHCLMCRLAGSFPKMGTAPPNGAPFSWTQPGLTFKPPLLQRLTWTRKPVTAACSLRLAIFDQPKFSIRYNTEQNSSAGGNTANDYRIAQPWWISPILEDDSTLVGVDAFGLLTNNQIKRVEVLKTLDYDPAFDAISNPSLL